MADNFTKFGRDNRGGFPNIPPSFSVPPPNYQTSGNINKGPQQWDTPGEDFAWNAGTYGGDDSKGKMNFRRDNRGMSNGGGNKDGFNKGFSGDGMVIQEDTIFVSGMDPSITEQDIHNHFGSIGVIKKDKKTMKPKIWLYKHKDTGVSKGEATVTYDDINAAKSAISWFDGRDFNGSTVKVSLAQRQNTWNKSGNKGSFGGSRGNNPSVGADRGANRDFERNSIPSRESRGGRSTVDGHASNNRGGGSNLPQREGDWKCAECNNTNFAWRNECNRCKAPKRGDTSSNVDNRRNFKGNNRGGMQGNLPRREENARNSNVGFNTGFSGINNRRDGGPVRNNSDKGGERMRPY